MRLEAVALAVLQRGEAELAADADEHHPAGDADDVVGLLRRPRGRRTAARTCGDRVRARDADGVRPPGRSPSSRSRFSRRTRICSGVVGRRGRGAVSAGQGLPTTTGRCPGAALPRQARRSSARSRIGRECVSAAHRQVVDARAPRPPAHGRASGCRSPRARRARARRRAPPPRTTARLGEHAASACCRAAGSRHPASTASSAWAVVSASTWISTSGNLARTASIAARHRPGGDHVVVLDHRDVVQAHALVRAAAAAHRVLLQGAQARRRLAGVEHLRARARELARPAPRVAVATPDARLARLSSVRSATSSTWTGPASTASTSPAHDGVAVLARGTSRSGAGRPRRRRDLPQRPPAPRRAPRRRRPRAPRGRPCPVRRRRDGRLRGDVAARRGPEVLVEGDRDRPGDPGGVEPGVDGGRAVVGRQVAVQVGRAHGRAALPPARSPAATVAADRARQAGPALADVRVVRDRDTSRSGAASSRARTRAAPVGSGAGKSRAEVAAAGLLAQQRRLR